MSLASDMLSILLALALASDRVPGVLTDLVRLFPITALSNNIRNVNGGENMGVHITCLVMQL